MNNHHLRLAYSFFRFSFGVNIFLHGLVRVGENYPKFHSGVVGMFENSILPASLVELSAHLIVPLEIIVGLFMMLGIFMMPTLIIGIALMLMLMSGMAFLQKWDIVSLQLNYIFFYSLLVAFLSQNRAIWHMRKKE